jgi:hydroxyacylglutathione hydrolase
MDKWITKNQFEILRIIDKRCNCYLISKENHHILIDSGSRKSRQKYLKFMKQRFDGTLNRENFIHGLILTHTHFDHAQNAAVLKRTFKIPIFAHSIEAEALKIGYKNVPKGTIWFTKHLSNFANSVKNERIKGLFRYQPVEADKTITEKTFIEGMEDKVYVLPLPGHTIGSLGIIVDNEIALVGDTMFGVVKGAVFPPYCDDINALMTSWKILLDTGCEVFLPGHGNARNRNELQKEYLKYSILYA